MNKIILSLALAVVSATAHAGLFSADGKDDNCTEDHSMAWCVLDYLDSSRAVSDTVKLKGKYTPNGISMVDSAVDALGVGLGIGELTGAIAATPGIAPALSGTLFLVSAMSSSSTHADLPHILVLMPPEIAKDDPLGALLETFGKAGVAAFEAESYEVVTKELHPRFGPASVDRKLLFKGGACSDKTCEIKTALFASGDYSGDRFVHVPKTPAYLGGGPVVQWARNNPSYAPGFLVNGKYAPQYAIQLAKNLPGWVYMHFGNRSGFPDPLVTGQGKVYWFLKPQKGQAPQASVTPQ